MAISEDDQDIINAVADRVIDEDDPASNPKLRDRALARAINDLQDRVAELESA